MYSSCNWSCTSSRRPRRWRAVRIILRSSPLLWSGRFLAPPPLGGRLPAGGVCLPRAHRRPSLAGPAEGRGTVRPRPPGHPCRGGPCLWLLLRASPPSCGRPCSGRWRQRRRRQRAHARARGTVHPPCFHSPLPGSGAPACGCGCRLPLPRALGVLWGAPARGQRDPPRYNTSGGDGSPPTRPVGSVLSPRACPPAHPFAFSRLLLLEGHSALVPRVRRVTRR